MIWKQVFSYIAHVATKVVFTEKIELFGFLTFYVNYGFTNNCQYLTNSYFEFYTYYVNENLACKCDLQSIYRHSTY